MSAMRIPRAEHVDSVVGMFLFCCRVLQSERSLDLWLDSYPALERNN